LNPVRTRLAGLRENTHKLGRIIEPGHRKPWVGLVVLALFTAAVEVMGGLVVFATLGVLTGGVEVAELPVVGQFLDLAGVEDERQQVLWFALVAALFFIIRGGVVIYQAYMQARVTERAGSQLSVRLLRGYMDMPYPFFLERNSAELTRNAVLSTRMVITAFLEPLIAITSESLVAIGFFVLLLVAAPGVTFIALGVMAPLLFLVFRMVRKALTQAGMAAEEENVAGLRLLNEGFDGIREIKLHGSAGYFIGLFQRSRERLAHAHVVAQPLTKIPRVLLELSLMLFLVGWLAVSSAQANFDPDSLARIGIFAYAALRLMPAANRTASKLASIRFGRQAVRNVHSDLVRLEREEARRGVALEDADPYVLRDAVKVRDVTFRFKGTREPALKNINLTIERGKTLGIVGETGAGKSTLLDLILGLHRPTEGSIHVDEHRLDDTVVRNWQSSIGVVSQSFFLSDDTLRNNIAFGIDPEEIDDARIDEVVRIAQLEDFVSTLPDGTNTAIGESGSRVSGGQRQRIAIARALYRDPAILVFDEGTSALDAGTEGALMKALTTAARERTVILVAHRLSTVLNADSIVLLVDGRIDDAGPFDDLASRNERFAVLAGTTSTDES